MVFIGNEGCHYWYLSDTLCSKHNGDMPKAYTPYYDPNICMLS